MGAMGGFCTKKGYDLTWVLKVSLWLLCGEQAVAGRIRGSEAREEAMAIVSEMMVAWTGVLAVEMTKGRILYLF